MLQGWVWSPQGVIDMHVPERWGIVQFSDAPAGTPATPFVEDGNDGVKWALRRLYYRKNTYRAAQGRYAPDLTTLESRTIEVEGFAFGPEMRTIDSLYEITAPGTDGSTVHIRRDGKVWVTRPAAR